MAKIVQTPLPGVGVRYDFRTDEDQRVGVVHHHGGRRELFVCAAEDPDKVVAVLKLDEDEAHTLVDALGVAPVVESLAHLQQAIEGLAIDWITVEPTSALAGRTIGDVRLRTRTGVTIVAIVRGSEHIPAPGPDTALAAGDTLVVIGTSEGIEDMLRVAETG